MLFGNEDACSDDLLFSCPIYLAAGMHSGRRIFTGRWGSGKTAQMFLVNKSLAMLLEELEKGRRKLWYLDENSLDVDALSDIRNSCGDARDFRFKVERIWNAEIIRAASVLLGFFAEHNSINNGPHWTFMRTAYKGGKFFDSVWTNIRPILKVIFGEGVRLTGAAELQGKIEAVTTSTAASFVQKCLADMENQGPSIAIGIEPIDTPKSPLEAANKTMAQDVIAALLNIFIRSYQPGPDNLLDVYIAIPWHRYTIEGVVNPQKRREYELHLSWEKDELKKFICERIAYEFRKVKRSYKNVGDVWNMLFTNKIHNTYCNGKIEEDSFDYILRHSHHIPRDVQRLCRESVLKCCAKLGYPVEEVLVGRKGVRVDSADLRGAALQYCDEHLEDFREEVRRRFPEMPMVESAIQGINVPFTISDLESRARRFGIEIPIERLVRELWESGFLGIEIVCKDQCDPEQMRATLPDRTYVVHSTKDGKEFHRWYLFSYNSKGDPLDVFSSCRGRKGLDVKCVLHAKAFERFSRSVTQNWPIGI